MKKQLGLATIAAALLFSTAAVVRASGPEIGKPAPAFSLTDADGKSRSLAEFSGKYVVLEWTNQSCPFVRKHYDSGNMQGLQKEFTDKGVVWLSIASSAEGKEGYESAAEWKKTETDQKMASTDVLLDADGTVGKLYGAKTTPHMFVIDPKGVLIYKGAIDDKPSYKKEDVPTAKNYVRAALDESMAGKPVSMASTDSYGCSVKYK